MNIHVSERTAIESDAGATSAENLLPEITQALAASPRQRDFTHPFSGRSEHYIKGFESRLNRAIPEYRFSADISELGGFTALRNGYRH